MNIVKVFVASNNPVKVQATNIGFRKMFPNIQFLISGLSAASNVSAQPMSEQETVLGALNRIQNLQKHTPTADYWVGIEGGIKKTGSELEAFAWVVIKSRDGFVGKSRTASFVIPEPIAAMILSGLELGEADDLYFGRSNSKQLNGSVGILTGNVITRTAFYEQSIILALIPFKNSALY